MRLKIIIIKKEEDRKINEIKIFKKNKKSREKINLKNESKKIKQKEIKNNNQMKK